MLCLHRVKAITANRHHLLNGSTIHLHYFAFFIVHKDIVYKDIVDKDIGRGILARPSFKCYNMLINYVVVVHKVAVYCKALHYLFAYLFLCT